MIVFWLRIVIFGKNVDKNVRCLVALITKCNTFASNIWQKVRLMKDNMTKRKQTQPRKGLYQSDYEHDACGVGMVVNIHGGKSHELVDNALKVLENMEHRGAETRDKTGDGAGIMVQIPHEFIVSLFLSTAVKKLYAKTEIFIDILMF